MLYFINVNWSKLIDIPIMDIYIFADFCLSDLSFTDRDVEVPNNGNGFDDFSFQFYQFCLMILTLL